MGEGVRSLYRHDMSWFRLRRRPALSARRREEARTIGLRDQLFTDLPEGFAVVPATPARRRPPPPEEQTLSA